MVSKEENTRTNQYILVGLKILYGDFMMGRHQLSGRKYYPDKEKIQDIYINIFVKIYRFNEFIITALISLRYLSLQP